MKKIFFLRLSISLFIVIIFLLFNLKTHAQQFPTPNAASIGIFGQYPQSGFTGVPSINIPVYDFSYEGISLPIQLTYNTNLVKPYQAGSWVGLGWNLTGGGAINRVVNGKPDDLNWNDEYDWRNTHYTPTGYYYNHSYLSNDWTNSNTINNALWDEYSLSIYDLFQNDLAVETIKDYSPDEFSFSVGDLSGSFYLDDQGNWKVRSKNKVKVIVTSADFVTAPTEPDPGVPNPPFGPPIPSTPLPDHSYLNRITLIDDRGIVYVFGGVASAVEDIKSDALREFFIKTWYLTSINFPNGKSVTFSYESGQLVPTSEPSYYKFELDYNTDNLSGPGLIYAGQNNHPAYLKEIHTDLQNIDFYRSEKPNEFAKLDSIKVTSLIENRQIKNFVFTYQNTPMDRLKLYSFTQMDENNKTGSQYFFQYNNTSFSPSNTNTDNWGYYTTTLLNPQTFTTFKASKESDTLNCRAELLDRIIYPTGGYTRYTWEPNTYSKAIAGHNRLGFDNPIGNANTGGVRIKQITNFDINNNRTGSKKYVYIQDFNISNPGNISSGVLYGVPVYEYYDDGQFSILPISPLIENNVGSHISYSEVTEINDDGGFTTTKYSNFDTGINNEYMDEAAVNTASITPEFRHDEFISNSHERGFPLSIRNYLNTGKLLNEKIFQYARIDKANEYVRSYVGTLGPSPNYNADCDCYEPPAWSGSAIKIYTNAYLLSNVTENLYNGLMPITNITNYTYDTPTLNLTSVTTQNSKGQTVEIDNKYPTDMVSLNRDPSGVYGRMISANDISPLIETVSKLNNLQTKLQRTDFIEPYTGQFEAGSQTIQQFNNVPKLATQYSYDDKGNATTVSKNGIMPTAYVFGYQKNLPIAKIDNASNQEVFHENFEESGNYGLAHTGTRYNNGAYYLTFAIPDGRSYKLTYWYRINNVWTYASEAYTGPHSILPVGADAIDDVCVYPVDATITTYTYAPITGITSITDTKGITLYYEYDGFQRLINIKDQFGNIKTHYCYNYAGEQTDCFVPYLQPPQMVYARIEVTNVVPTSSGDDVYGYYTTTGDISIHFYTDATCSTPLVLNSAITVTMQENYSYATDYTSGGNPINSDYNLPANISSIYLGNMVLEDDSNYYDDNIFYYSDNYYNYRMITNSTSNYVPLPTLIH
jgi:YD repeat-containing protein